MTLMLAIQPVFMQPYTAARSGASPVYFHLLNTPGGELIGIGIVSREAAAEASR
jgi:hypothetical protein